jgi:hypothetical protein
MSDILTEKEKEEIASLGKNFNLVKETPNYNYVASRRLDISRVWSKKLLRASIVLNVLSVVLLILSFIISSLKPPPEFYASTPSGKIYHLEKLKVR